MDSSNCPQDLLHFRNTCLKNTLGWKAGILTAPNFCVKEILSTPFYFQYENSSHRNENRKFQHYRFVIAFFSFWDLLFSFWWLLFSCWNGVLLKLTKVWSWVAVKYQCFNPRLRLNRVLKNNPDFQRWEVRLLLPPSPKLQSTNTTKWAGCTTFFTAASFAA